VPTELDETDRVLLRALQKDVRTGQAALGRQVGLSAAAVNRRIRRLTVLGFISRSVAVLDPDRLDHPLTVITMVEVLSEDPALLDALSADLVADPRVQQCYYVTGEWDFVLTSLVRDMTDYNDLTRTLLFASGNVRRFRTLVAMQRNKVGLEVPV
jgi:Lrp/AsnC family leucine-responsive transcriptional regulator